MFTLKVFFMTLHQLEKQLVLLQILLQQMELQQLVLQTLDTAPRSVIL